MKRFSEQLHKEAKSVKLQAAEKRELRERLVSYMEYHPLPADMKPVKKTTKQKVEKLTTEAFTTVSIPFSILFKSAATAAAIVLVVVPFMAERAVPGDTLYAVKVQFNEEVRGSLTFDSFQKVEWETERLNRRIAEARLLASEGRLTEEVEAEVAAAVKEHTESAQKEIEVLRQEDADEAAIATIALDTTLEVQSQSLKADDAASPEKEEGAANLIADVIDESRSQTEKATGSSTQPSYAKLMARVERNTTRMYELSNALNDVAPQEQLQEVTRRMADIERTITEAIQSVDIDEESARADLIDALQRSQKLIVYMTEIEVQATVDIETLVPVVLTEEEKLSIVASSTTAVINKAAALENALTEVEEEEVVSKVAAALEEVDGFLEIMQATTTDFATFETTATDATTLLNEMLSLLNASEELPELPVEPEVSTSTATGTDPVVGEEEEPEVTSTTTPEVIAEPEPVEENPATTSEATPEEIVDTEI